VGFTQYWTHAACDKAAFQFQRHTVPPHCGKENKMVFADFQVNNSFPSIVGGYGTDVKYFPRILGQTIAWESQNPQASNATGQLVPPGNDRLNGEWFDVLVAGEVVSGSADSSVTAEVALYANVGTILTPNYIKIATTQAQTLALSSTPYAFGITCALLGDTESGVVRGTQTSTLGSIQNATAALTANLSGINFSVSVPFGLVCGVQFTTSDNENAGRLYQFQLA
jgi:hypothetical protein